MATGKYWPVTAGGQPIRRRPSLIDPQAVVSHNPLSGGATIALLRTIRGDPRVLSTITGARALR
jgi:hypothetical protein